MDGSRRICQDIRPLRPAPQARGAQSVGHDFGGRVRAGKGPDPPEPLGVGTVKTLGSTGLSVTPIGLGLAAVGRPVYITAGRDDGHGPDRTVAALEARTHQLLDAAYSRG